MNNTVVVTRHPGLLEVLRERGVIPQSCEDYHSHVTPDLVRGKDVIGILPLSLAAEANSITEITLSLPPEARGKELNADEVRRFMTGVNTYKVTRI